LVRQQLDIEAQYRGYLTRQDAEVRQLRATGAVQVPEDIDYAAIGGLGTEARDVLGRVQPRTLDALSRIPGITPPNVMAVVGHLRRLQA
jgi:tRNA uridine 5-carboxymethylaminomethyl modification enzyme